MTFAATTGVAAPLDSTPDDVELSGSEEAAQYIAHGCLVDGPLGRVGLELEAHCFDPVDPHRRPGWAEITQVLELVPPLPSGSAITVEPGGAVELSGPPADGIVAAISAMKLIVQGYLKSNRIIGPAADQEKRCHETQATTAFMFFALFAFIATTVVSGMRVRSGGLSGLGGLGSIKGSNPSMTEVSSALP